MIGTIHQPDFMPWFGFFRKIARSDKWIILDHVKNNPRQASFWGRRVQILVNGKPHWISITLGKPRDRESVSIPINEMTINTVQPKTAEKQLRTFDLAYSKSPYYKNFRHLIREYFESDETSLLARNLEFVFDVMSILDIKTETVRSSMLPCRTSGNQLLVDLLRHTGSEEYLHGLGASSYQDDQLFVECGIVVKPNQFEHPQYRQQHSEVFQPGLSILDMLFNSGLEQVKAWVHE